MEFLDNLEPLDMYYVSANPNAVHLLERNPDEINWSPLSGNPSIFTYDYKKIKEEREELNEEIIKSIYHPKFIKKFIEDGNNIEDYLN